MLLVGLTGGIGSGKSTAADLLRRRGAVVIDADVAARAVVEPGRPALAALAARFGAEILLRDGNLDRPGLARRAFADEESRLALNGITWPAIVEEFGERIAEAPADAIVVCDVPLLAEGGPGSELEYAAVIVVEAPHDLRLARLEERGIARDDGERRMAAQASDDTRREYATYVLDNSGDRRRTRTAGRRRLGRARAPPDRDSTGSNCHTSPLASSYARARSRLRPVSGRGSASGHRRARGRGRARRQVPDPARHHGLGQELHHRRRDREDQPADARARAQQEPGRAAHQRVPRALPQEPGRVLRLLLRLLPARGLPPDHRHLHREGLVDQRRDRPAPALGHQRAHVPARRGHRRVGVGHLRARRTAGVRQAVADPRRGGGARPACDPRSPRRAAVRAQRHRLCPQQVPGARRHHRGVPRLRGAGGPDPALRRRGRAHRVRRPAHRRGRRRGRAPRPVPGLPLRHRRRPHACRDRGDRGRARRAAGVAGEAREAARGPAPPHAHHLRPRDDARDRRAARASRTTRATSTVVRRASARSPCSTTSPTTSSAWSTSRT